MLSFIVICVLFLCVLLMWLFWQKDHEQYENTIETLCDDCAYYQERIAELQHDNDFLRGKCIIDTADEYSAECDAAKAGEWIE